MNHNNGTGSGMPGWRLTDGEINFWICDDTHIWLLEKNESCSPSYRVKNRVGRQQCKYFDTEKEAELYLKRISKRR